MIRIRATNIFQDWLDDLRDRQARALILKRLARLEDTGNFGTWRDLKGIGELKIDHGPGYRVYFQRRGDVVVLLLSGGDKRTQNADIKRARDIAKSIA